MFNRKYFFIAGFPRSGTTLLSAALDRHSEVAVTPETSLLLPFNRSLVHRCVDGHPDDLDPIACLIRGWAIDADLVHSKFAGSDGTKRSLMKAILDTYADSEQVNRVGEKTPAHLGHLATLFGWFPESKAILMIRDGRDAIVSAKALPGKRDSLDFYALHWNRSVKQTLRAIDRWPNRVHVVRYEELVAEPESVVANAMHFLGVKPERGQLDPANTSKLVLNEEHWKAKVHKPIDASRAFAWKRVSDRRSLRNSDLIMRQNLLAANYEPPHPGHFLQEPLLRISAQAKRVQSGLSWYFNRELNSKRSLKTLVESDESSGD